MRRRSMQWCCVFVARAPLNRPCARRQLSSRNTMPCGQISKRMRRRSWRRGRSVMCELPQLSCGVDVAIAVAEP